VRTGDGTVPAYHVQTAVDAEHALIVGQKLTRESNDPRTLQPMAEAAKVAVGEPHILRPHRLQYQEQTDIALWGRQVQRSHLVVESLQEKGIADRQPVHPTHLNHGQAVVSADPAQHSVHVIAHRLFGQPKL
jgi:hypothetical protein